MDIHIPDANRNPRIAKIIGFDTELMNVLPGVDDLGATASRALLAEVRGVPAGRGVCYAQDQGRLFLPGNAGSVYIDLDHLEIAGPECRSARDYVAQFHAMLGIARQAAGEAGVRRGTTPRIHTNNSDGCGNSWGGHLSVLLSETGFEWIFRERIHYLLWLASAQVSSLVITGAGKTGAENGAPDIIYQISQRADFFECLSSIETTRRRPLVNTRDEPLGGRQFARLHCIFHDTTLCHNATWLKGGIMQVLGAMVEAEMINPCLCFEEPLAAVHAFSHDPSLRATARLIDGRYITAVEHQLLLCEHAHGLLDNGGCDHVPDLAGLLETWRHTLELLQAGDLDRLARKLDWVAKQAVIERAVAAHAIADDPSVCKTLDFAWSELEAGIYQLMERRGLVDVLADAPAIARATSEPPADTRAYVRSRLLRRFGGSFGLSVDWHEVALDNGQKRIVVSLPDPSAGHHEYGDLDSLDNSSLLAALQARIEFPSFQWRTAYTNLNWIQTT